ncbi:MAG: hypothetical protein H6681_04645 [Desulfobacteraceae bacterium]|nr:hypothetical protein [Desulfobacteraceae bacterium]MCB9494716.1 hypothetical protein [Desulfobacteraceae bacterium]
MKKIFLTILFAASFCVSANAMNIEAFLYANNSTVDGRVAYIDKIDYGYMEAGVEAAYKSDEFELFSADLGVKSDDFMPGARYKLGFRGVYADAEKNSSLSSQLASICFLLGMDYDLPSEVNPINIPVSFGAELSFSPEPLTWDDGEDYFEGRLNMNLHIMGNAAIILEYRYIKADFEEKGYEWDKEDHNFLFGYKIRF